MRPSIGHGIAIAAALLGAYPGIAAAQQAALPVTPPAAQIALPHAEWRPLPAKRPPSQLRGIWRNERTGHMLRFSAKGYEIFHILDDHCTGDTGVVPPYALYRLDETGQRLELPYFDYRDDPLLLQNAPEFKRWDKAPPSCFTAEAAPVGPLPLFDIFWRSFDRHYAFFRERGVDWHAQRRLYRPQAAKAADDDALFDIFVEMLRPLQDGHVNLSHGKRHFNAGRPRLRTRLAAAWQKSDKSLSEQKFVAGWSRTVQQSAQMLLDPGTYRIDADGALQWGKINQSTGYIRVNRFHSFASNAGSRAAELAALKKALNRMDADLQDMERLIVDVAHNGGGHDAAAMLITQFFMDAPREVLRYAVPGTPVQPVRLAPARQPERRPIALLTSEITASAAEAFVLMMRALPHVTHVGEPTRGGLSSLLPKPLPRGFRITLAYQRVLDAKGRLFEARGIPPERPIALFPDDDLYGGYARAIRALAAPLEPSSNRSEPGNMPAFSQ